MHEAAKIGKTGKRSNGEIGRREEGEMGLRRAEVKYSISIIKSCSYYKWIPYWEHFASLLKENYLSVISKKILREFWIKHSDCQQSLKSWFQETSNAVWNSPKELKTDYPTASFLMDNRVVFNIKGNKYRLIVKINYDYHMLWIRFIGTHSEYDKIDATKI